MALVVIASNYITFISRRPVILWNASFYQYFRYFYFPLKLFGESMFVLFRLGCHNDKPAFRNLVMLHSSAVAGMKTPFMPEIAKLLITYHSVPRKLPWAQAGGCESDLRIRLSFDGDDCPSTSVSVALQPLCSLTSAPRPCFVPTLCPVESLAPTFSNHNYIPAERRRQQSKEGHSMKEKGVTMSDTW